MKVTEELSVQIKARMNEFVGNPDNPQYLRDYAQTLEALPIYRSWGGFWAIRPDGEIILQYEEEIKTEEERDSRIRNLVLFQGSKTYPELLALIPSRTDGDLECPYCLGKGIPKEIEEYNRSQTSEEQKIKNLVCYCGGLGWLPKGYQK